MPENEHSPLARLVLFLVCLSLAGILVAGIHYLAIDLPQQNAVPEAPKNTAPYEPCPYPRGGPYFTTCFVLQCDQHCCHSLEELTILYQTGPCMF